MDSLWFYLPAILVNLFQFLHAQVFGPASHLAMDLKRSVGEQRWIGDSRGLTSVLVTPVLGALMGCLLGRGDETVLIAIGAQMGMVANSFVKRRRGLPPGAESLPWDSVDFVLGATVAHGLVYPTPFWTVVWGLLLCGWLHRYPGRAFRRWLEQCSTRGVVLPDLLEPDADRRL